MSAEVWLGLVLGTLIGLVAYFFNKWLTLLEGEISEAKSLAQTTRNEMKSLRNDFSAFKSEIKEEIKNHPQIRAVHDKISSLDNVREFFKNEAIPQMKETKEAFGRIIQIERKADETEAKVNSLLTGLEKLRLQRK